MAVWGCAGCRTCYRARLFRCPRCHGTRFKEESMPKISRTAGPSHAAAVRAPAAGGVVKAVPPVGEDDPPPTVLPERENPGTGVPMEGVEVPADGTMSLEIVGDGSGVAMPPIEQEGAEPSPGSSSETSPERLPSSPVMSETVPPKRAPKTGSRSRKGRTGSSTAGSTATSTEADEASKNE